MYKKFSRVVRDILYETTAPSIAMKHLINSDKLAHIEVCNTIAHEFVISAS